MRGDPDGRGRASIAVTSPPLRAGVEIFDAALEPRRHEGKARVRREILSMRPEDGARVLAPVPGERAVFWGVTAANGIPIVLRTRGFSTAAAASRDAVAVLSRVADLATMHVHDLAVGRRSFWLMRGADVVLVAGQATGRRPGTAERLAARAVRVIQGPVALTSSVR